MYEPHSSLLNDERHTGTTQSYVFFEYNDEQQMGNNHLRFAKQLIFMCRYLHGMIILYPFSLFLQLSFSQKVCQLLEST
jgi:hypothetical protein